MTNIVVQLPSRPLGNPLLCSKVSEPSAISDRTLMVLEMQMFTLKAILFCSVAAIGVSTVVAAPACMTKCAP